jgi:adenylate cyclase
VKPLQLVDHHHHERLAALAIPAADATPRPSRAARITAEGAEGCISGNSPVSPRYQSDRTDVNTPPRVLVCPPVRRRLLAGASLGLAAAAVAFLLGLMPFVKTVELKTYDWRIRLTASPADARRDVVMVAIDQASIRNLEPLVGRWPWPRFIHGALLDFLARAPAKAVVYDVIFAEHDRRRFTVGGEEWTGEESDQALVEATRRAGMVVHVADVASETTEADASAAGPPVLSAFHVPGFERRPSVVTPFRELAEASRALGHNLVVLDPDGPARRAVPFVEHRGKSLPSLAVAAVAVAEGLTPGSVTTDGRVLRLGTRELPLIRQEIPSFYGERAEARRALVRFPGGVLTDGKPTYREHSFYDLFYSEQQLLAGEKPLVDPASLKGAIVLVGTTAPGLHDLFSVPLAGKMPGMQVHASALDNLLSGRFLAPAPAWAAALVLLACALAAALGVTVPGVWRGLAGGALVLAALLGGSVLLFGAGTWLQVTPPFVAVVLAAFGGVAYQYLVEDREKRKVKQLFSRYVSRDVCEQLMADPSRARLGGSRREMTVLFSDIRGFTTFSEAGQPEEIVQQLNEYFTRMVEVVFSHRGTLDKFVGDAVMALFGAPLDDPDHAEHAVQAARAMLRELEALNRGWAAEGRPTLAIGVGINTGEMVAGNIGSESIMSYTVIGDAVNLASRLESLNKQYGTSIIVSETTRARLKGYYQARALGDAVVKGKTRAVPIFEIS